MMASDYERIRLANIREYGEGTRHLAFLGQLYTDRTHFVFELLQNAEDAGAQRVDFVLYADRLEVRHDGRPFDEADVVGICGVGEGTKAEDLTKIGRFGVGFKSVYSYCAGPEIHSGDEYFRIEHYVRPHAQPPRPPAPPYTTCFAFPFDRPDVLPEEAFAQIAERLLRLSVRTLLFLRHIAEISWRVDGGRHGTYLRETAPRGEARRVQVLGESDADASQQDEAWLVFERAVDGGAHGRDVRVEAAFLLAGPAGAEAIVALPSSPLVVFFPTEKETRLGFLIQGPYRTTPARDNIPPDDPWNRKLMEQTAVLVAETLPVLREMGLLTVGLLRALPIAADGFPQGSMCRPIFERVRSALLGQDLLPIAGGGFSPAARVRLARGGGLREILSDAQLQRLYESDEPLHWLPAEVTADREPTLYTYLRTELKVEELTPEAFGARITLPFLAPQSDAWMAQFYEALLSQRALWQGRGRPLRGRPILRLEDGRQVAPFGADNVPTAYLPTGRASQFPTVKRAIVAHPPALDFLRQLGLGEPDTLAELRELILPRYVAGGGDAERCAGGGADATRYASDLRSIAAALRTDSLGRRQEILKLLREAPWVVARNAADCPVSFKMSGDVYLPSAELDVYFMTNHDAWFVDTDACAVSAFTDAEWHDLGVASLPRLEIFHPALPESELAHLRKEQPYTRDIRIDDYQLDGLERLLHNYLMLRDDEVRSAAGTILRVIVATMAENSPFEGEQCFQGVYQWQYHQARTATFRARWIAHLREHAWLPSIQGGVHRPADIGIEDLPPDLPRDPRLTELLDLGATIRVTDAKVATLAEEVGVRVEDLRMLREHHEEFAEFLAQRQRGRERDATLFAAAPLPPAAFADQFADAFDRQGRPGATEPQSEAGAVANPERRRERTQGELAAAQAREPRAAERFVRVSMRLWEGKDPTVRQFLLEEYRGACQICGGGFLKVDGTPYFEALSLASRVQAAWLEHPGNALCLCAGCSARMRFGAVEGEDLIAQALAVRLRKEGGEGAPCLAFRLCGQPATLRFSERHFLALQEMLRLSIADAPAGV